MQVCKLNAIANCAVAENSKLAIFLLADSGNILEDATLSLGTSFDSNRNLENYLKDLINI